MKFSLKILSLVMVFVLASCGGKDDASEEGKGKGVSATGFDGKLAGAFNSMDNAVAVITIDLDALKEKSDLANTLTKIMGPNPEITMGLSQVDGLLGKLHIIASVNDIDVTGETTPEGSAILMAKILDGDRFSNLLAMAPLPTTDGDNGFKIMELGDQMKMAYNDDMIAVFFDANGDVDAIMEKAMSESNTEMNEMLANSINGSSDISIYGDLQKSMNLYQKVLADMDVKAGNMDEIMKLYDGSSIVVDFNFENGKFVTTLSNDIIKNTGDKFNFAAESGVSKDILGMVGNNPIALGSFNMNFQDMMKVMGDYMKKEDLEQVNKMLAEKGLDFETLTGLFDGQFAIAFNGIQSGKDAPEIGAYIGVSDPSKVEALLPSDAFMKDANGIYSANGDAFIYFGDKYILVGTNEEFIKGVVGGSKGDLGLGDQESILSSPFNYVFDFNKLTANPELMAKITSNAPEAASVLNALDKAYGSGTISKFEYVIETKDKSTNILIQIIEQVNNVMNEMKGEFASEFDEDSKNIEDEFNN